ncbi:MAG: hypothetical protein Q9165_008722 [Trypethelium subeluteriae]
MDGLSAAASVIAVLQMTLTITGYLSNVKEAAKERESYAIEASNLYSLLVKLLSRIEADDGSNLPWRKEIETIAGDKGPLGQLRKELARLQPKLVMGGRANKMKARIAWHRVKDEVASAFSKIERLKTQISMVLDLDHFKLSQKIEKDTKYLRETRTNANLDEKHRTALEWLTAPSFDARQMANLNLAQKGSGSWFLKSTSVGKWLNEPGQIIFCPGIPGAGKSIIAAITIDFLSRTVRSEKIGLAYLYLSFKPETASGTYGLLVAILKQLLRARPDLAEPVYKLKRRQETCGTTSSIDEIVSILKSVMGKLDTVYIVIDALDECSDQDGSCTVLLETLFDLRYDGDLRLMCTSRYMPEITGKFKGCLLQDIQALDADIEDFVQAQFSSLHRCIRNDAQLQHKIKKEIVTNAAGMFLLARLHVESLRGRRTRQEVLNVLETLSSKHGGEVLQVYDIEFDKAMARIGGSSPEDEDRAKKAIYWIAFSIRPLTAEELCHALAIKPDQDDLNFDDIVEIEDVLDVCAGLLNVEDQVVSLMHITLQGYLERSKARWYPAIELDMTNSCLAYISYANVNKLSDREQAQSDKDLGKYVFLPYAQYFWREHGHRIKEKGHEMKRGYFAGATAGPLTGGRQPVPDWERSTGLSILVIDKFVRSLENILLRSGREQRAINLIGSDGCTALASAAEKGDANLVRLIVQQRDVDVNRTQPLWRAVRNGHEEVVRALLDCNDIDVNRTTDDKISEWASKTNPNKNDGSPLHAAMSRPNLTIVKLLLGRGASVNCVSNGGITPLHHAAKYDFERAAKILLNAGASVHNSTDKPGSETPLLWAVEHDSSKVLRLLLGRGASVGCCDGRGIMPLHYAAAHDFDGVAKLLLDAGASVHSRTPDRGETPLSWAAKYGSKKVTRLLLDHGANANTQGCNVYHDIRPLTWAIQSSEDVVRLLLSHGASVNFVWHCPPMMAHIHGSSPLQHAVLCGNESIAELLLTHGADINLRDSWGNSVLLDAANNSHEGMVRLLLHHGCDINSKNSSGYCALDLAVSCGSANIVQLLLENGADVISMPLAFLAVLALGKKEANFGRVVVLLLEGGAHLDATDDDGMTVLHITTQYCRSTIVKMLLERGAEVDVQNGEGITALHIAAQDCKGEAVRTLLEHGAQVDLKDKYGRTALWLAASRHWDSSVVMRILVDYGARIDDENEKRETILAHACKEPHVSYKNVEFLLDHGASVNQKDLNGCTPLWHAASCESHYYGQENDESIVRLLLRYDADPEMILKHMDTVKTDAQTKSYVLRLAYNRS